jgi:hypothetical protein
VKVAGRESQSGPDAEKIRIIKVQSAAVREGSIFLAGGTGLAVRLKHRTSRDLDWFTAKAFDADSLRRARSRSRETNPHRTGGSTHALGVLRRGRDEEPEQVARALTSFDDAEPQPMPGSSKYSWPEVKKALVAGVQLWERTCIREPM